jgi:hypothetical protein
VKRKVIYVAINMAVMAAGSAYAQDYSEYGMHRPMTDQELTRYGQCQETVRPLLWPTLVDGKQMTIPEALGPALTKRMCACTAIRLRTESDTFPAVWQSCAQSIIGPK